MSPTSFGTFDNEVTEFLRTNPAPHYLDVGAGDGKYGRMLHSLFGSDVVVSAIEPELSYVQQYKLRDIYATIGVYDADVMVDTDPDFRTDIVIMGDVIEHMRKSRGLDFLNYIVYRCRWLIIVFPIRYIQGAWEGHTTEAHRSVWDKSDFEPFDLHHYEEAGMMRLAIVRGFRE